MRSNDRFSEKPLGKPNTAAVILCAGKGERTGLEYNKVFYHLGQRTVLETVLDAFCSSSVERIAVVTSEADKSDAEALAAPYPNVFVCTGGATRFDSVRCGLKAVSGCDIVVIHDGARPYIRTDIIEASIDSAVKYGSGIAAVPSVDTVKEVENEHIVRSLPRAKLYNMQTPQTFRYSEIVKAYDEAQGVFTDDSEVYERAGFSPRIVPGDYGNIKITTPGDLLKVMPDSARIGAGFDVHRLVENRPLILGGIRIDYEKGLLGHSDADVLVHAIMDAILSAAGLPDIGVLFPDDDPEYLGISSMKLLDNVIKRAHGRGYDVGNISAVIIAQKPKLSPIISEIAENIAAAIGIDRSRVNVSATTTEMLGIVGSGEAIAASASCILTERYDR